MNPLVAFDYLYYRIVYFYENAFSLFITGEIRAIGLLSVFQYLNLITLLFVVLPSSILSKLFPFILIFGLFLILLSNLIRYKKIITYITMAEKWDKEPEKIRLLKKRAIICYFFISIFLFILTQLVKGQILI